MPMLAVVIPARNEASRVQGVIRLALGLKPDLVIPVLNGCKDMTADLVKRVADPRVRPLHFQQALGLDVPRIAGARAALQAG
ncbi:MAG TPA: glycosyltransferase, partial [Symbiobacteriaceae bacterium]|nr:glycosyltransferase [Symbiobacteriaceae bacterium]